MFNLNDLQNKRNELEQALNSKGYKRNFENSFDVFACSCSGGCEGSCEQSCYGHCTGSCGSK